MLFTVTYSMTSKKQSAKDRFEKLKWWFAFLEASPKKIFIERFSGRAKAYGEELGEITRATPSSKKSEVLKVTVLLLSLHYIVQCVKDVYCLFQVEFSGQRVTPLAYDISHFDYTANAESRKFEPFVKSTKDFCKYLNKLIAGGEKEPLCGTVSSISDQELDEDWSSDSILVTESAAVCDSDRTEWKDGTPLPKKRSAPKELPEVDPLPSKLKKGKNEVSTKEDDNTFLDIIKKEYLIREGMSLRVLGTLYILSH